MADTTHDASLQTPVHARRPRLVRAALLGLLTLAAVGAGTLTADEKKPDGWCNVIEKQIEHNREEARKPQSSAGTERLREERRRLDQDAHERRCPGH